MTAGSIQALTVLQQAVTAAEIDLFAMIFKTGIVVGGTLAILIFFSIASWGIILYKYYFLKRAHNQSIQFLDLFWKSRRLDQIYEGSESLTISPIAQVFRAGYIELSKSKRKSTDSESPNGTTGVFEEERDLESVERALRRAATSQITVLESLVSFLATTGSTAPFIGLFGTVWGIMTSFTEIGRVGNATLATVAPGISEALIATATGLAAAIPAVVGYNYFVQKIKVLDAEMENFSIDFLNIIKRHFF